MNISSLCRREIVCVSANASIREAAEAMRQHHVGALVVTDPDESGRAVGVVTDRNLVVDLLATGLPVDGPAIGELCSRNLVGVLATATIPEAVQVMRRAGVRRLLVVEPGGSLLGLVSADDLFEAIAGELEALAGSLRTGISRESLRTMPDEPGFELPRAIYLPGHEP
jgi:CBS domain-containing protein